MSKLVFQKYIQALAVKSKKISQEQRRSERLILKLLPPSVATRLIEQKVNIDYLSFMKVFTIPINLLSVISESVI